MLTISMDKNAENTIVITDAAGKVEFTHTTGLVSEYQLDMSKFAKGVYLLTLTNKNGQQTTKFVVE